MCTDASEPDRSGQLFAIAVWGVTTSGLVFVALRESEVDEVDEVGAAAGADDEIVGLEISMQVMPVVGVLKPCDLRLGSRMRKYHLLGKYRRGSQGKFPMTIRPQVLQIGSQQLHH